LLLVESTAYLRELAIGEVLEERTLSDRTVADQYQPKLVIEDRLYHLGEARRIRLRYVDKRARATSLSKFRTFLGPTTCPDEGSAH